MSLLNVNDISCSIAGRSLLSQITFSLQAGEVVVVVGRNGAGKSTLLKHLTGDMHSSTGKIEVFGKALEDYHGKALARKRAVLPQSTHLNFAYKVLEVVLLGRIPHQQMQRESEEDFSIARQCLQQVGLGAYEGRDYLTLSGGEQQRVHLARALAQLVSSEKEDKLLFLDEPTSSLDIAHQHQVLEVVKDLSQQGVGVLAILHDLNLAAQYAHRILVLSEGKILAIGTPQEVLTEQILQEAFRHRVHVLKHPTGNWPLVVSS